MPVATGADADVSVPALREALRPFGAPPPTVVETHGSWVVLTATHAYKLKKPLRFDFADLRSGTARRACGEEEVRGNQELAAALGYRLCGLRLTDDVPVLVDPDEIGIDQWLVVTRRFDEATTLASRVRDASARPEHLERLGARLAAFHARAPRIDGPPATRLAVLDNLDALAALDGCPAAAGAVRRFSEAFLASWDDVLRFRAATGRVVDGHGDLRAEHVLVDDAQVTVFDRLDLPALRQVDLADDLAFLCMDLEAIGAPQLVAPLLDGYVAAGGERPPQELLAFFAAHRAAVRAKVALIRGDQPGAAPQGAARARSLLALAERWAARARGETVLVVTGPPAVGKSTVAAALQARTGLPVLRSDEVRDELGGEYDPQARAAVYAELGRRAGTSGPCIVDATFGEPALRHAFLAELDRDQRRRLVAVECRGGAELLRRRAARRVPGESFGSRADVDVAARLAQAFTPFDELAPADRFVLETDREAADLADEVLGWLDRQLGAGRLA